VCRWCQPATRPDRAALPDLASPHEAVQATAQVGLEQRLGHAEAATPFRGGQPALGGLDRAIQVAQAMLADLGHLDPGPNRVPAGTGGQAQPRGLGVGKSP
jgi:hypothetical protein